MRGHVRKRGNRWAVVYDEGRDENGKRKQRWVSGFGTKRDAEAALSTALDKLGRGDYVAPSKATLRDYLEQDWLPGQGKRRRSTYAAYSWAVNKHILPRLGSRQLQALNVALIKKFYGELEDAGLAVESRRLIHNVLRKALGDAVTDDKLARNPVERVPTPGSGAAEEEEHEDEEYVAEPRTFAWTAKEVGRLLAAVATDRLFALWRLGATTGMRRGELLGLTWRSLDLERASLRVTRQLTRFGTYGPPKSKRSRRAIRLDPQTVAALKRHQDAQRVERALAGDAYADEDLVFCDELGGRLSPPMVSRWFLAHRNRAGLTTGTLHTLRHTAATLMLVGHHDKDDEKKCVPPMPLHVVAARLGDSPQTVLASYAHLLPHNDEQAAEGMATLLAG